MPPPSYADKYRHLVALNFRIYLQDEFGTAEAFPLSDFGYASNFGEEFTSEIDARRLVRPL